jgi:hypothetical protein
MRFRLASFFVLLSFAASLLFGVGARAAEPQAATNAAPSTPAKPGPPGARQSPANQNGLKQLEQDLFKPFQGFSPKTSLDGVVAPAPRAPAASAVQSKRMKELMERRKDWAFMSPEDLVGGPSVEEIFNVPQDNDRPKLSPMERYYEQLYHRDDPASRKKKDKGEDSVSDARSTPSGFPGDPAADANSKDPRPTPDSERTQKKSLESNSRGGAAPREGSSMFADIFGLGKNLPSREEIETQKLRMDRFKNAIGIPTTTGPASDPLNVMGNLTAPARQPLLPSRTMEDSPSGLLRQNGFDSQLGTIMAIPTPAGIPDLNTRVFGPSSLAPALPKIDPPRAFPTAPSFTAPKRVF